MKRGVDRNFVVVVVVLIAAAVFLSNVRPSISGMGGTSFAGQGVGPT